METSISAVILGASDPEMSAIEEIARHAGIPVFTAEVGAGRVHPGNAYRADGILESVEPGDGFGDAFLLESDAYAGKTVVAVECGGEWFDLARMAGAMVVKCDHHKEGDAGFGRPASEFLAASSVGQVIAVMVAAGYGDQYQAPEVWAHGVGDGKPTVGEFRFATARNDCTRSHGAGWVVWRADTCQWLMVDDQDVLAAAGDHCPGAAYRGECPGVDPDALMAWRAETRAAFQGRPVEAVLADVEFAMAAIEAAPTVLVGGYARVADFRDSGTVPELPEAALRLGRATLAVVKDRDGQRKVVLGGNDPEQAAIVAAFLRGDVVPDLEGMYGDPARGFAGGYLPE